MRRERAAERVLEDERLRGSLTDDQFQPLLDWALAAVDSVAVDTAGMPDPIAEERLRATFSRVRETLMTIDDAAKAGGAGTQARLAELTREVTAASDARQALDRVRRASAAMDQPRPDETSA